MTQLTIAAVQSDISQRIAKKFGIKQTDLRVLLSKTRGKLPRGFEKDLSYLFDAEQRTRHPKRRMQVDQHRLEAVRRSSMAKLARIDFVRDKSRAHALWMAEFASRMLIYVAAMVSLLYLLGFI